MKLFRHSSSRKKPKKLSFPNKGSFIYPLISCLIFLSFFLVCSFLVNYPVTSRERLGQVEGFKDFLYTLPAPAPYPINKNILVIPELSAKSVLAIDVNSSVILYQQEIDSPLLPASITKIMTTLVALDYYRLDEVLTVGSSKVEGNTIKLISGEQMTVENLLYGLLVSSANDAAQVLAENYPRGVSGFVEAMNQKAKKLMLVNTHFSNPMGFDEETHYSTAHDLAQLASAAIKNPVMLRIVSTSGLTITDVSGTISHYLVNTNELVNKLAEVKGIKTGWTKQAGECLITFVEKNGVRIITVILGSKDRFGETQTLLDWIFSNFEWQVIVPASYH